MWDSQAKKAGAESLSKDKTTWAPPGSRIGFMAYVMVRVSHVHLINFLAESATSVGN